MDEVITTAIEGVLTWRVLLVICAAAAYGIFVGAVPGLTATMAVALMVPLTFYLSDVEAVAAIVTTVTCSIFAGDIPATLVRIPGTPASAAYTSDAYALTLRGEPERALAASLVYSVIGVAAYDDSAGAKRVTETVLATGADIVFGMGDGATFGMIEAVTAFNTDNPDSPALFIDVIGDKSASLSRDILLTSVLFDYRGVFEEMIRDLDTGEFGKVYTMDVANGGVRLLDLPLEGEAAPVW